MGIEPALYHDGELGTTSPSIFDTLRILSLGIGMGNGGPLGIGCGMVIGVLKLKI